MSLSILLDKIDRRYRPRDIVVGKVILSSSKDKCSHNGIRLLVEGKVKLGVSASSVGMLEAFYAITKPIDLLNIKEEIAPKLDTTDSKSIEIPFEFRLNALPGQKLFETYHGVYVSVMYQIGVETTISSGWASKQLSDELDFIVEVPSTPAILKSTDFGPLEFSMNPDKLSIDIQKTKCPHFNFKGILQNTMCPINQPLIGEFQILECDGKILSIDLQLIRKESVIDDAGSTSEEGTECSRIQIGQGNIQHKLPIPIYFVFPRLYAAPTFKHRSFSVDFDLCVQVFLEDTITVTETIPLLLVRK